MRREITATAPGKVNLHFGVGPLASDGYHSVSSLYQALSLLETVKITNSQNQDWSLAVSGTISEEQLALVPTDDSNLVFKATLLAAELAGLEDLKPIAFEIKKQIPVAGGMAGGSADAAAALLAACAKFNLEISKASLMNAALNLGADVPFALLGGTAVGTGRGELLQPLKLAKPLHFVMITNDQGLSTPRVYAELDRQRSLQGIDPRAVAAPETPQVLLDAISSGDLDAIAQNIHNDLELAACSLLPELEFTMAAAVRFGAKRAFVSGSGPTVAALVESSAAAEELARELEAANFKTVVCHSVDHGAKLLGD